MEKYGITLLIHVFAHKISIGMDFIVQFVHMEKYGIKLVVLVLVLSTVISMITNVLLVVKGKYSIFIPKLVNVLQDIGMDTNAIHVEMVNIIIKAQVNVNVLMVNITMDSIVQPVQMDKFGTIKLSAANVHQLISIGLAPNVLFVQMINNGIIIKKDVIVPMEKIGMDIHAYNALLERTGIQQQDLASVHLVNIGTNIVVLVVLMDKFGI